MTEPDIGKALHCGELMLVDGQYVFTMRGIDKLFRELGPPDTPGECLTRALMIAYRFCNHYPFMSDEIAAKNAVEDIANIRDLIYCAQELMGENGRTD